MGQWNTVPTPTQAKAYLGVTGTNAIFTFNPDEVKWSYKNNTVSRDTIGGRVVQILSSDAESMIINGRAGSREALQTLGRQFKNIMSYQVKTGNTVDFKVPSRDWEFKVFLQSVSGLGWDVGATSYPYQIALNIKDDLSGLLEQKLREDAFMSLAKGIGYNPAFHGGDPASAARYVESMLGAIDSISLAGNSAYEEETSGKKGKYKARETGGGGNATMAKALLARADLDNVPQVSEERFITIAEIYALAYWALDQIGNLSGDELKEVAIIATAVSCCETQSHDTQAKAQAVNDMAYGLWQMNEGLGTSLWDPVVSALHMAEKYYASGWAYWSCGPDKTRNHAQYLDEVRSVAS